VSFGTEGEGEMIMKALTPCKRGEQSTLLRMQHIVSVVDGRRPVGYRTPRFLTFKQGIGVGRQRFARAEHGTKVYFVKQLQVHDKGADDDTTTRLSAP